MLRPGKIMGEENWVDVKRSGGKRSEEEMKRVSEDVWSLC